MDWADDTAYSLNDLVDSTNAGFVTTGRIGRWAAEQDLTADDRKVLDALLEAMAAGNLERIMNRKIGEMVAACTLVERDNFMADLTNRYRFGMEIDPAAVREQKLYAKIARDLVFQSPQVCQLEHKGGFMLERLFGALYDNYIGDNAAHHPLLSRAFEGEMAEATDDGVRARIICDYLAGMTDGFASRAYKRFFDPDFGSIVDLV